VGQAIRNSYSEHGQGSQVTGLSINPCGEHSTCIQNVDTEGVTSRMTDRGMVLKFIFRTE
jgi:hypothetical protein